MMPPRGRLLNALASRLPDERAIGENPQRPVASLREAAFAWHRAFSPELRRWRGAPQQPGLMMALEHDGRCAGIACRLPDARKTEQLGQLL
jgi:cation transport regulator ChaC